MTLSRLLCAGAVVLLTAAGAAAKPGVASSTVNLRADPNTASDVLVKIPAGARIEVGECNDGWCAVTFQGKTGYSIATSLDTTGRSAPPRQAVRRGPPPPGGPAYAEDDDAEVVQGPAPRGYVRVPGPGAYVEPEPYYAPRPYYAPGPYWGPYWGPRHRYWW